MDLEDNDVKYYECMIIFIIMATFLSGCKETEHYYYPKETIKTGDKIVKNISVKNYLKIGENDQIFQEIPQRVFISGQEEAEMAVVFCNPENIIGCYTMYDLKKYIKPVYKDKVDTLPIMHYGEVNVERMLQMKPDLIIAQQEAFRPDSLKSTEFWNSRGIKTYVPKNTNSPEKHIYRETIEEELQYIRDFGIIFHKEILADAFIQDIRQTIQFFLTHKDKNKKRRVMVVEDFGGTIGSYDRTKLAGRIVEALGGESPETLPILGKEDFMKYDPDVLIVVCSDGSHGENMKTFTEDINYRKLKCIKNKAVYSIQLEMMYAPGIRLKDGIECIGLAMYPELEEEYKKTQKNTINHSYLEWLTYRKMEDLYQKSK